MAGAGQVRAVRDRIRSVENTAKVTRAMELVAASKMRRAQERALAARPYAAEMRSVLAQLGGSMQGVDPEELHPLLAKREVRRFALIHITSDRGLAGGLNSNMNRASASLALERQPNVDELSVLTVGRKGRDFFHRAGYPSLAEFTGLGDFPSQEDTQPIARIVKDDYIAGKLDEVYIGYQSYVNAAVQRPVLRQILPVEPPEEEEGGQRPVDFIFEPSPEALLATLLPRYVDLQIFEAILDARASEQSARMVAMHQATEAAGDMVAELTLTYNKARQDLVTGELLDIIGGKAAVEA